MMNTDDFTQVDGRKNSNNQGNKKYRKKGKGGQSSANEEESKGQGNNQRKSSNNQGGNRGGHKTVKLGAPTTVSKEKGFTGLPKFWFDNVEYNKALCGELAYHGTKGHDYYYGSYSHFYIHEEMLKDTVRTQAYRTAIESNPEDFKDKIVLDIGAGTCILSMFAVRAGAKHVYSVENAEIALFAEEIVRKNGMADKITILKGKMEEVVVPVPQVDIIVSEWMGYFLLYESMLDCVMWARDKYLAPGGKILPDKCKIFVAGIEDASYKHSKIDFWKDVYGFDMTCLGAAAIKEPLVDSVNSDPIISDSCKILELDLCKMDPGDVEFSNEYCITFDQDETCHALLAWFDCMFSALTRPKTLSTSPYSKYTHWK
jgi:protein arginine N-methyltransferase 1